MSRPSIVLKRRAYFFVIIVAVFLTVMYLYSSKTTSFDIQKPVFNSDKLMGKTSENSKIIQSSNDGDKHKPSVGPSFLPPAKTSEKSDQAQDKPSSSVDVYKPVLESKISSKPETVDDPQVQKDAELFQGPEVMVSSQETDWPKLGEKLRLFKKLHELKYNNQPLSAAQSSLYEKAEKYLFSWIKPSFSTTIEMRSSFSGNGIVICIGNGQFRMALATLKMIRNVHFSNLPIEVFYMGDQDLSAENRKVLESLNDVKTRDITQLFDDKQLKLGGWAIKTFALLASSFQNAMLIDADVVFLQSPEVLFASRLFGKYGTLFFHDRSLFSHGDETKKWFKDLMPSLSEYSKSLRVFHDKTGHEQESGVVLINKKMHTPALLASCTLNVADIRDRTYKFVFGDKETFWIGFETVGSAYRFNGYFPGTIGVSSAKKNGEYEICGRQLLHVDEHQVPTWINGGIQESKYDHSSPLVKMESYVMEPGEWVLQPANLACLVSRNVYTLPEIYSDITAESGKILMDTLSNK